MFDEENDMTEQPIVRATRVGRAVTCPSCGSGDMVPILYGVPDVTLQDKAAAGEVVIGGCLRDDDKAWHCRDCGSDSQDQPRPERFAVWSADATGEEIASWVVQGRETGADEDTP